MKKEKADQIITEYFQKLYGFSVKKSFSYDEAEELCAEIALEVYQSLLKAGEIANIDGYIWRISEHTYARYVSSKKKRAGVSIDDVVLPYYDEPELDDGEDETRKLRREITFLSQTRRKAVFLFYYRKKSIAEISAELSIPEGTVKWHLNKARSEIKEGLSMERKIGMLGLHPVEAVEMGHRGFVGKNGGPEGYLSDKINLNIVYSVYYTPRTREEISEEIGISLVYIEDRIKMLEENGFLVKTKGEKYTTYLEFNTPKYSRELEDNRIGLQLAIAEQLAKEYVPLVREAIGDAADVYIPGGNRELLEAAAIFYGIAEKCGIDMVKDLSKYEIHNTDGGIYQGYVNIPSEASDPAYEPVYKDLPDYSSCGAMYRMSEKYPAVFSWSVDNRFSSRTGGWQNNLTEDYEYLYEWMKGEISETTANAEKIARLKERGFLTGDNAPGIMIMRGTPEALFGKIPELDKATKEKYAAKILDYVTMHAKDYPPQMQELIVTSGVNGFISNRVAVMVMDILYNTATLKPLTESEKTTANLIMFSDILPE